MRKTSGRTTVGAWRNFIFRLSAYCRMQMVKLIMASPIQTAGLPGKKNSMAVMFQVAMSQAWCQRNNSGMISTKKVTATTPTVVKSSGFASR